MCVVLSSGLRRNSYTLAGRAMCEREILPYSQAFDRDAAQVMLRNILGP